jgi:hypothetical protein
MSERIGCAIITCDRPEMFKKCFSSDFSKIDQLIIINDGKKFDLNWCLHNTNFDESGYPKPSVIIINTDEPYSGVAKSKNLALEYLLDRGFDHIFLMEDDMRIIDNSIFDAYINASKATGIQHLMFGYHGPANKNGISGGEPHPRLVVKYSDDMFIKYIDDVAHDALGYPSFIWYAYSIVKKILDSQYTLKYQFNYTVLKL